jgi:hypothetical protein
MKKNIKIAVVLFILGFLNSCSSTKLVKLGIGKVKKIAVISLQSNTLRGEDKNGKKVGSLTNLVSAVEGVANGGNLLGGNPLIERLLKKTSEVFASEFKSLAGNYQVVSGPEIYNNPAYKEFVAGFFSSEFHDKGGASQPLKGYSVVPNSKTFDSNFEAKAKLGDFGVNATLLKKSLEGLAKKLGVDSIACRIQRHI